jgi:hypothetical protein
MTHIDLGAQDINGIQRPKSFFSNQPQEESSGPKKSLGRRSTQRALTNVITESIVMQY